MVWRLILSEVGLRLADGLEWAATKVRSRALAGVPDVELPESDDVDEERHEVGDVAKRFATEGAPVHISSESLKMLVSAPIPPPPPMVAEPPLKGSLRDRMRESLAEIESNRIAISRLNRGG